MFLFKEYIYNSLIRCRVILNGIVWYEIIYCNCIVNKKNYNYSVIVLNWRGVNCYNKGLVLYWLWENLIGKIRR